MLRISELKLPKCEKISPLIPKLVHGELSPVQRGTVLAHFLHCPRCAEDYHLQLERAVAAGEVILPSLNPNALERARKRMKWLEAGISVLWEEIRGKASRWAQEKREAIIETLRGLSLLWQPLPVTVTTRGTRGIIRTRGGIRGENVISAELLNSDLEPSGKTVPLEILSEPQFTPDGRFRCELTTDKLHLEGHTISLTISTEDKPVVAFTAKLLKAEEKKLRATFSEDGFDGVSPSLVPLESIRLQVLPM